jgi:CBS domain-containing protein
MKVSDAMAHTISKASPKDPLSKVAELMKQEDAGFMPVVEGDKVVGVITDRDIVIRCIAEKHGDVFSEPVEHCMSTDVVTVQADAEIDEAAHLMEQREIRRLPVMEDGKLVGVLSHGNLVQATRSSGPADEATLGVTRGA